MRRNQARKNLRKGSSSTALTAPTVRRAGVGAYLESDTNFTPNRHTSAQSQAPRGGQAVQNCKDHGTEAEECAACSRERTEASAAGQASVEGDKPFSGAAAASLLLFLMVATAAVLTGKHAVMALLYATPLAAALLLIAERSRSSLLPEALDARRDGYLRGPVLVAGAAGLLGIALNLADLPGTDVWLLSLPIAGLWAWQRQRRQAALRDADTEGR